MPTLTFEDLYRSNPLSHRDDRYVPWDGEAVHTYKYFESYTLWSVSGVTFSGSRSPGHRGPSADFLCDEDYVRLPEVANRVVRSAAAVKVLLGGKVTGDVVEECAQAQPSQAEKLVEYPAGVAAGVIRDVIHGVVGGLEVIIACEGQVSRCLLHARSWVEKFMFLEWWLCVVARLVPLHVLDGMITEYRNMSLLLVELGKFGTCWEEDEGFPTRVMMEDKFQKAWLQVVEDLVAFRDECVPWHLFTLSLNPPGPEDAGDYVSRTGAVLSGSEDEEEEDFVDVEADDGFGAGSSESEGEESEYVLVTPKSSKRGLAPVPATPRKVAKKKAKVVQLLPGECLEDECFESMCNGGYCKHIPRYGFEVVDEAPSEDEVRVSGLKVDRPFDEDCDLRRKHPKYGRVTSKFFE